MKTGDIVARPVNQADPTVKKKRLMPGKVIYIHPLGKYHVVEFQSLAGRFRESFSGV